MSLIQTRPSRLASQQSMEKTLVILNEKDVSDVDMVEVVDTEKCKKKNKNEVKTSGKLKSTNIVPIVTQKSRKYDLNYFKQFNRRLEHCERDLFRIHDPIKNKNDHGSKDHGLVYIEFNAGLFQAMKSNMMKIAKDYNISLAADPKIELYGNAEERMLLDLKVMIKGQEHFVKMKVYNTTCGMDFQALKHDIDKRFDHLDGRTVGEFFTQKIIVEIANTLCNKVDIKKLNDYIKKLALVGKDGVKAVKKCSKFDCTKETSKGETITCIYCESLTHKSCINNSTLDVLKYRCESCLINNISTVQSTELLENENILRLSLIDETQLQFQYHCNVCKDIFTDENALRMHMETKHEARKRSRGDTSLVEGRCDCDDVSKENERLNNDLRTEKERKEAIELQLEAAKKDLNEKNEEVRNLGGKMKIDAQTNLDEIKALKESIKSMKEDIDIKAVEITKLIAENESLRKVSEGTNNLDSSEEVQRLRSIVQDREKAIKKANEEFKKEIAEQKRAKQNAEENLNSAIQENTKIKEKETTLYEIMEGLRKLLDLQDKESTGKTTGGSSAQEKPDIELIDGAVGGAIPKAKLINCEQCKFSATNMSVLNKHVRQEHLFTTFPCVTCNFQTKTINDLRHHQRIEHPHGITSNSKIICEFCDFVSDKQSTMFTHERNIHQKNKYQCNLCTHYFTNPEKLKEHKTSKHNVDVYPCNECGYKAKSIGDLDMHIEHHHENKKQDKDVDIRDLSSRTPCNPQHPSHSSECCDRAYFKQSGAEEQRSRGQCRYWVQGRCYRGDSCRFAHIKLCKYQDQCLNYKYCGFLHFSEQKPFLESRMKKRFVFREEDFPRLERKL